MKIKHLIHGIVILILIIMIIICFKVITNRTIMFLYIGIFIGSYIGSYIFGITINNIVNIIEYIQKNRDNKVFNKSIKRHCDIEIKGEHKIFNPLCNCGNNELQYIDGNLRCTKCNMVHIIEFTGNIKDIHNAKVETTIFEKEEPCICNKCLTIMIKDSMLKEYKCSNCGEKYTSIFYYI